VRQFFQNGTLAWCFVKGTQLVCGLNLHKSNEVS
jgi:hypothetical protein